MTIAITAATGHLGRLTADELLRRVPADQVVLVVRDPTKAAGFAERGVTIRQGDYGDPATLDGAFDGVRKLLLISGNEVGKRVAQHTNVLRAAKAAGVEHVIYTSAPHADTTTLSLAPEHKATEQVIRDSGLAFTFLRNNWYTENYADRIATALATGTFVGAAGEGRVASATRADFAAATAAVLAGSCHENQVYELSGDVAWSFPELAAAVTAASGREVTYQNLSVEKFTEVLVAAGLPEGTAAFAAHLDGEIAEGVLDDATDDLRRLIGRPTTPLAEAVPALLPA
jgi:NAD(P)H dehydrogenase (quinone)